MRGGDQARVFFALWPDAATAHSLHRLAESLKPRFGGRVMRLDSLHLTLAFVGSVPRERIPDLLAVGASVTPRAFDLTLDVLGEWARKQLVWVGPSTTPEPLAGLADELHQGLVAAGFSMESRPFVPHVTLLRNAACATQRTSVGKVVRWWSEGFVLVESKLLASGARYEVVGRW